MSGEASARYLGRRHRLLLAEGATTSLVPPPGASGGYAQRWLASQGASLLAALASAAPAVAGVMEAARDELGLLDLLDVADLGSRVAYTLRGFDLVADGTGPVTGSFLDEAPPAPPPDEDAVRAALAREGDEARDATLDQLRRLRSGPARRAEFPALVAIEAPVEGGAFVRRLVLTLLLSRAVMRSSLAGLVQEVSARLRVGAVAGASDGLIELSPTTVVEGPWKLTSPAATIWVDRESEPVLRERFEARTRALVAEVRAGLGRAAALDGLRLATHRAGAGPGLVGRLLPSRAVYVLSLDVSLGGWPGRLEVAVLGPSARAELILRRALASLLTPAEQPSG